MGIDYIPDCNVSSTSFMFNNCTECLIGLWNNGNYLAPFLGSIDMSQTYININGVKWWSGTTSTPTEPYVRIPRVVCMQGTLDLTDLDSYGYIETRRLVASKKPTKEDTYWYNWYYSPHYYHSYCYCPFLSPIICSLLYFFHSLPFISAFSLVS